MNQKKRKFFLNENKSNKSLEFIIKIKIYIFNIIPIIAFKVDKDRFDKFENKKMVQKIQARLVEKFRLFGNEVFKSVKKWDNQIFIDIINSAKKLQAEISKVDLRIGLGFENVLVTTGAIPALSTAIAVWFRKLELKPYEDRYEIRPIYACVDKSKKIEIFFKCIIGIKMIHIIRMLCIAK